MFKFILPAALLSVAFFGYGLYAQSDASSQPTGGTTETRDANASVGDNTSTPAESTEIKREKKKAKKVKKGEAKAKDAHHDKNAY